MNYGFGLVFSPGSLSVLKSLPFFQVPLKTSSLLGDLAYQEEQHTPNLEYVASKSQRLPLGIVNPSWLLEKPNAIDNNREYAPYHWIPRNLTKVEASEFQSDLFLTLTYKCLAKKSNCYFLLNKSNQYSIINVMDQHDSAQKEGKSNRNPCGLNYNLRLKNDMPLS